MSPYYRLFSSNEELRQTIHIFKEPSSWNAIKILHFPTDAKGDLHLIALRDFLGYSDSERCVVWSSSFISTMGRICSNSFVRSFAHTRGGPAKNTPRMCFLMTIVDIILKRSHSSEWSSLQVGMVDNLARIVVSKYVANIAGDWDSEADIGTGMSQWFVTS